MRNKIIYLVWVSLLACAGMAQQPTSIGCADFVRETGVPASQPGGELRLPQRDNEPEQLFFDLPLFRSSGVRAVMPFGFLLNRQSQIAMALNRNNRQTGEKLPLNDTRVFSHLQYEFADSTLFGIILYPACFAESVAGIEKELASYFGKVDFRRSGQTVYSDDEFVARVDFGRQCVEVYSLFHYPLDHVRVAGVKTVTYSGFIPCFVTPGQGVRLAFFNQVTKENNVQLAFKVYMHTASPFGLKSISFIPDGGETVTCRLETELTEPGEDGLTVEKDTRTFLFPDVAKKLLKARTIRVVIDGAAGKLAYDMPAYQRYSLFSALEYYRWNVTNPMVKYSDR